MLYLIGLGLGGVQDITLRGLDAIKSSDYLYLDSYTSILCEISNEQMIELYGKPVHLAHRQVVEDDANIILSNAATSNVAFLVVGDPFGATTHSDLILRARAKGIKVEVIHNASIMSAVACCGLQLYSFGETVTIPFWDKYSRPTSFIARIEGNFSRGLHTLCLLDLKIREVSIEDLLRGRSDRYMPPRYMTVCIAAQQMIEAIKSRDIDACSSSSCVSHCGCKLTPSAMCVALARVGSPGQCIAVGALEQLAAPSTDELLGGPLHSLVVIGAHRCHPPAPLAPDSSSSAALSNVDAAPPAQTARPAQFLLHPLEAQMLEPFALSDAVRDSLKKLSS